MKNCITSQYEELSKSFLTYEELYESLISSNSINICQFCLDIDGIWKRLELKWMIEYFERDEQYEKCIVLKHLMTEYYVAGENEQNRLNRQLNEYCSKL